MNANGDSFTDFGFGVRLVDMLGWLKGVGGAWKAEGGC